MQYQIKNLLVTNENIICAKTKEVECQVKKKEEKNIVGHSKFSLYTKLDPSCATSSMRISVTPRSKAGSRTINENLVTVIILFHKKIQVVQKKL